MSDFQKNGYLLVPGLINTSAYFNFFKKLVELGKGKIEDKQVPGARSFYGEPLFEKLLEHLLPKIELHTGHQLKPHRDRSACEITAILALGVTGDI